ncbi:MAG TPA: DivIVA domain-containing protein [Candidatus Faecousia intestinigallinarum]|nr:DivIVA domain-containing protein [Candidatus Faecousia intestinigallinarum]
MFTPQQIDQISFGRATFGGYDMQAVDEFLEPLTEDYVTLYKENALLKSKMRVLVGKLEEYRKNEASMKDAIVNAQKTCDMMVKEAEAKCKQMLSDANAAASENAKNASALIAAEDARVEEARKAACMKIDEIADQIRACLQALDRIKAANAPAASVVSRNPGKDSATDAVANEISMNLEALVGSTDEPAPKPEPKHPVSDTTSRFTNMNLQFGRNYDPTHS